ncbi:MAG: hypothetical protein JRM79_00015 [Nitrososphaerota archaeon]|nr:hypothetical protein [Nitrososphaerota archaeon]MDG6912795.1 hypothetical protein [Nitrososphaerota archaeon]MDG6958038.1 hypothetical protein [Nitrososphaerota archaeon]MDG6969649.1 hypothetical protein [Nitrososphaerota archaeon]MDG6973136.1 hypothetical protein [Nitrososphaerota archaeon]
MSAEEREKLYRTRCEEVFSRAAQVTVPIRAGHLALIGSLCDATNSNLESVLAQMLEDSIEAAKDHFEYDATKFLEEEYPGYAATKKGV